MVVGRVEISKGLARDERGGGEENGFCRMFVMGNSCRKVGFALNWDFFSRGLGRVG